MPESPSEPFVTLSEFADHINAPSYATDAKWKTKLQEVLDAALESVEEKVGPLGDAARTERVYATGRSLVLGATHLESVTSVVDPHGNTVTINENTDVNHLSGIVEIPRATKGSWRVTYRVVQDKASLRLAVKIIGEHLWETQRGSREGARGAMMGQAASDGDGHLRGFAIPRRAAQLIQPFVKLPGIA